MKQKWERITINITPEEYGQLQVLASVRRESVSKFVRSLIRSALEASSDIVPLIEKARFQAVKSKDE